jgi:hypothetical protein
MNGILNEYFRGFGACLAVQQHRKPDVWDGGADASAFLASYLYAPVQPVNGGKHMSLGISLFLLAVGAVLAFAVTTTVSGVEIATVGWILMAVGVLGIFLYFLFLASFAPFYRGTETTGHTEVVERPTNHVH